MGPSLCRRFLNKASELFVWLTQSLLSDASCQTLVKFSIMSEYNPFMHLLSLNLFKLCWQKVARFPKIGEEGCCAVGVFVLT